MTVLIAVEGAEARTNLVAQATTDQTAAPSGPVPTDASVATSPAPPSSTTGNLGHPYNLPRASRARMHQCAVTWQHMKLEGTTGGVTWRVFATGCLTAGDPAPNPAAAGQDPKSAPEQTKDR